MNHIPVGKNFLDHCHRYKKELFRRSVFLVLIEKRIVFARDFVELMLKCRKIQLPCI